MYKKHGDRNIIILHGGPGAIGSAHTLAKGLLGVEILNYGRTIQEQINEINEAIVDLNMKFPTIVGHSWGAWLAYIYAAKYPVKKIVLVGCGAFDEVYLKQMSKLREHRLTEDESKMANDYFEKIASGKSIDLLDFNRLMTKMDSFDALGHEVLLDFDFIGHGKLMSELNLLRKSKELLAIGQSIKADIIVIHGLEDPHPVEGIVEPFEAADIEHKLHVLDKCGHSPWLEKHAQNHFYNIIENELKYDFTSERLGFRCFKDDYQAFRTMNQDDEVMNYFPKKLSAEESDLFHDRIITNYIKDGYGLYAVDLLESGEFIGFIGLAKPKFEMDFTPCIEIGWRLDKNYWRKGYAKEGAKRVLSYAKDILMLDEIVSFTSNINVPSIAVMATIGMTFEKKFLHPNISSGPLREHVLYKIIL